MAVYRRNYKPYSGPLTAAWSRCFVLFRYSRRNLFRSKFLTAMFVVCFFYPLACLLMIYLAHNVGFLQELGGIGEFFSIDNNVLGKSSVLAILLSQITWVPGLVLFGMQATLAGPRWTWDHLWIAGSIVLSSLLWIAILSLLAMALSAWVKWRIVAGALLLAVMFFGAGFAEAVNAVLQTQSGHFFNVAYLMTTVWNALFQVDSRHAIPVGEAWVALLVYCAICLGLLMRKVRAYEVIR